MVARLLLRNRTILHFQNILELILENSEVPYVYKFK